MLFDSYLVQLACSLPFGIAAVLALIRLLKGPTALDRMIASDVLLTIIILFLMFQMLVHHNTLLIPVLVGIAATAALATITVARFVRRKDNKAARLKAKKLAEQTSMVDVGAS